MWSTSIAKLATRAATTKGGDGRRPEIATTVSRATRQVAMWAGSSTIPYAIAPVEPSTRFQSRSTQTIAPTRANASRVGSARRGAKGRTIAATRRGSGYRRLSEAPLEVRQLLVQLVRQVLAEASKVLVHRRQLDLPLGGVDRDQLGHRPI